MQCAVYGTTIKVMNSGRLLDLYELKLQAVCLLTFYHFPRVSFSAGWHQLSIMSAKPPPKLTFEREEEEDCFDWVHF